MSDQEIRNVLDAVTAESNSMAAALAQYRVSQARLKDTHLALATGIIELGKAFDDALTENLAALREITKVCAAALTARVLEETMPQPLTPPPGFVQ